jgi:hypothetical protein
MPDFTLSDYKLQAYLLANAEEIGRQQGRGDARLGVIQELGLDTYIKKLEFTYLDNQLAANSLNSSGSLDFVADLPDKILNAISLEATVYKVFLNEGSNENREIEIPLPHNSQQFFGEGGANLAGQSNTFKQTRTFLQAEALQNEYFTSQRFVSEALTGKNASAAQGVQIGNIEIVRLGGNPAEVDTNITVKITLFATQLDNYFKKYDAPNKGELLADPDISEETKRYIENGVAWIDLLKINLEDGGGESVIEQFAAAQGIDTTRYLQKAALENGLAYNSSQQKIKLKLGYNTEQLDMLGPGKLGITQDDFDKYKEQIKAQTEVYYLNLHQNAINFNAADKSVEIQIDYVAATGTNIIERQTDLLFDAYLYEKELQANDAICAIQKEVDNEQGVAILIDPFGADVIQSNDSEFERGTGSNRRFATRPEGTIRVVNTPEEKQKALADLDKLKKRLQTLQANKLINGLYASSLYPILKFKQKVDNSISQGIEKFTRANLLFVPAQDVTGKITGKITPETTNVNLGVHYYNAGSAVLTSPTEIGGYVSDLRRGSQTATAVRRAQQAAQRAGFQDEKLEDLLDNDYANIIAGDEINLEYVFFGDIIEVAFEVLAANNRLAESTTFFESFEFQSNYIQSVRREPEETGGSVEASDYTSNNVEFFVTPFYYETYAGQVKRSGPYKGTRIDPRVIELYKEYGEILFSNVSYKNPADINNTITISLADVPISMIEFKKWFVKNVSSKRKRHFFIKNYIESLIKWVSKLIGDAVAEDQSKTTDLEPPELLINRYFLNVDKYNFLPAVNANTLDNRISITSLRQYIDEQATSDSLNAKVLTILGQTPNVSFGTGTRAGNKDEDKEFRIPHILYGGAKLGLLNDVSFQREDMPGLREARLFEGENMYSLDILREKYNATIRFYGNNFFKPGTYLYLNPASFGAQEVLGTAADLQSPARLLGLGGYYLVVRVSHEVDLTTNTWYTYVDTQWQAYGDDDRQGTTDDEDECKTSIVARSQNALDLSKNPDRQRIVNRILATGDEKLIEAAREQEPDLFP